MHGVRAECEQLATLGAMAVVAIPRRDDDVRVIASAVQARLMKSDRELAQMIAREKLREQMRANNKRSERASSAEAKPTSP
jgi:hypothetical protein